MFYIINIIKFIKLKLEKLCSEQLYRYVYLLYKMCFVNFKIFKHILSTINEIPIIYIIVHNRKFVNIRVVL